MIRKAFVLVLSVIICCSLYAADRITYAVNGACSGVVSALVSQLSDPRISLQGVTVSSDSPDGWNVSFVRSDVSTYRSSLRFFAGPDRSAYLDSIWAGLAGVLSEGNPFFFDEIGSGLKIRELQKEKEELLKSLELFYKVFFLNEEIEHA